MLSKENFQFKNVFGTNSFVLKIFLVRKFFNMFGQKGFWAKKNWAKKTVGQKNLDEKKIDKKIWSKKVLIKKKFW